MYCINKTERNSDVLLDNGKKTVNIGQSFIITNESNQYYLIY